MIYICLTADYEVFLGKNYSSIDDVLIQPTNSICSLFAEYNVSATFFVDVLYLRYLERNGYINEYELLVENIKKVYCMGHSIQLHIHPHWLMSCGSSLEFSFDKKFYRLGSFMNNETGFSIETIISLSVNYLKSIMNSFDNHRLIAYRAGGWSIQPEAKILTSLQNHGIRIDSSVLKNESSGKGKVEFYDYSKSPSRDLWTISPTTGVNVDSKDDENQFIEIPVFTQKGLLVLLFRLFNAFKNRLGKSHGTNKKRGESCLSKRTRFERFKDLLFGRVRFTLDNTQNIPLYLKTLKRIKAKKSNSLICMYFHPKLINDCNYDEISRFLSEAKKMGAVFLTLDEALDLHREGVLNK